MQDQEKLYQKILDSKISALLVRHSKLEEETK